MKGFTTLMKIAIMAVTISLVAVLVISALPLVMGGVNVRTDEDLQVTPNGLSVDITGKYTVVSSIDQDISDLTLEAYLVSRDGSMTKELIKIGPETIDKDHPEVPLVIDASIPMAEVALFFVTDNMDNSEPGLVLPVTVHVKGTYNSNLAGVDMSMVFNIPLSDTGSFTATAPTLTGSGEVSHAEVTLSGLSAGSMADQIMDALPPGGTEFTMNFGGKELIISIDKVGDDITLDVGTGDEANDSIMSVINDVLDAIKDNSTETVSFDVAGEHYEFSPSDIESADPAVKENVEKYMTQIEGVSDSLGLFLKKYAEMYGGA